MGLYDITICNLGLLVTVVAFYWEYLLDMFEDRV